uniref:Putative secreted protein n=1 Tax=Panstrongylus lignarius TaxID=156445 RepID=A0A224XQ53_9HEMI
MWKTLGLGLSLLAGKISFLISSILSSDSFCSFTFSFVLKERQLLLSLASGAYACPLGSYSLVTSNTVHLPDNGLKRPLERDKQRATTLPGLEPECQSAVLPLNFYYYNFI